MSDVSRSESVHECDRCLDERPCMPAGPLWICGDCEADAFMLHAATGGDIPPASSIAESTTNQKGSS